MCKSIITIYILLLFFSNALNQRIEQSISVEARLEELKVKLQQCRDERSTAISQIPLANHNNQTGNSELSAAYSLRSNLADVSGNKKNPDLQLNSTNDKLDLLTAQQADHLKQSNNIYQSQNAALTQLYNNFNYMHMQYQVELKIVLGYITDLKQQIANLQSQARADDKRIKDLTQLAPRNCLPFGRASNVNHIYVPGMGSISVSCDNHLAGPGWTVIQRRLNGKVDFYRSWSEYTRGFGNAQAEFFIGLELLYQLTRAEPQELYIQLQDFKNETRFAHYNHFVVGSRQENYKLKSLGNYTGTAGDLLIYNLYQSFSTYDNDNDYDEDNCASDFQGAWWYAACGASNLNGPYRTKDLANMDTDKGILWANSDWHDWSYSFQTVTMMIRPRSAIN